jgi:anti-sigma B factor antagonist
MQLKIDICRADGIMILECSGRLVFGDETAALRDQVKDLVAAGKKQIVLELGRVTHIDSGGLGTLVGLYATVRNAGGVIKLANLTQKVRDLLQITKLVAVFEVYASEEEAIEAFRKTPAA